jgi:CheY-like chemotaxis protein
MTSHRVPNEVVIIDDDADICEAMAGILESEGYRVATFTSATEALLYLRERTLPGLIVVDARMPGCNGWDFLEDLRRNPLPHAVPVFLATADTTVDRQKVLDCGAQGTLKKPFVLPDFLTLVARHCQHEDGSILIVDDDETIRECVREILGDEGYRTLVASNGKEALEVALQSLPRLILLDLMMPVMTGWETMIELAKEPTLSKIPVVIMSAYVGAKLPPNMPVLRKPVDLKRLLSVVVDHCGALHA